MPARPMSAQTNDREYMPETRWISNATRRWKLIAACSVFSFVAAAAGAAVASTMATPEASAVHACVKRGTGAVRIVRASGVCLTTERAVAWNVVGPTGPPGPPGLPGPGGEVFGLKVQALGGDDTPMFGVVAWDSNTCATDDSPPGPMAGTGRCTSVYPAGTTVTFSAQTYNREAGPELAVLWGGDASVCAAAPTCSIVMDGDKEVTVTFTGAG